LKIHTLKAKDKFPTRDYNRAINIPEYIMPLCLEVLNGQVREKCTPILKQELNKMKHHFSNTTGFLDIKLFDKSIPIRLRKIIENDNRIKALLSDIESLTLKQRRGNCCS
jgi:hypothetical protein